MTATAGRSLELYYVDGRQDGMITAELFNWTGHVLLLPRTQIGVGLSRAEANHAGTYLLLDELEGTSRVYVGESEDVGKRIRQHIVGKDWWTYAVLITAAANKLNKAHVRYLECRLIEEAIATGRVPLDNSTIPARPSLSEADIAKMESFLENLLVVLPAVRVDLFIRRTRVAVEAMKQSADAGPAGTAGDAVAVRLVLRSREHSLEATAVLIDGEFIVEKGSTARIGWSGQASHGYARLYDKLARAGIVIPDGDRCRFTENYVFASPSAAAALIYGRTANGPSAWRLEGQGITYREWETQQLAINEPHIRGAHPIDNAMRCGHE